MMKTSLFRCAAFMAVTVFLILGGCMGKSTPTKFYTLTPISDGNQATATVSELQDTAIGLGPVKLADYLDQSWIITRGSGNRIVQSEFDQWSGSLKDNLTNVLAENIGYLLGTDRVFLYPWRTYMPVDYQVTVDISRFDGQPGGGLFLVARWSILDADAKKLFTMKRTEINEETDTGGYEGMIAAQSRALGRLSQEIAEAIRVVIK